MRPDAVTKIDASTHFWGVILSEAKDLTTATIHTCRPQGR